MKPEFSDAIKVKDGIFYNLSFHIDRINRTTNHFFGKRIPIDLSSDIIPEEMRSGLFKCRIVYSDKLLSIEYIPYKYRVITGMEVVHNDIVDYQFKSTNRKMLTDMLAGSTCDEILIAKNGAVTDASSSNVVFGNSEGYFTPSTYLLQGTKREYLLRKGIIAERDIRVDDLDDYSEVYLINAMIDLEDRVCVPISNVVY